MDVPPEIAFRNVNATDELKAKILDGIEKLEKVYDHLISCRVMVEDTTPDRESGRVHRVRLEISVPHQTVLVDREPTETSDPGDVGHVLTEAFGTARRRLIELKKKQRGRVKTHSAPPHGRVVRILGAGDGAGYGFLAAADGRELYFHENAVIGGAFEALEVGSEVRYSLAEGEGGPHASTVSPLD